MRIATWNVNSVKVRAERLERWLRTHDPDVLCLQELKSVEAQFPYALIESLGYHATVWGEKTYNGVAILSKHTSVEVQRGFKSAKDNNQARLLSIDVGDVRVICVYVPNGGEVGSDKYAYKLRWLDELHDLIAAEALDRPLVLCGDFNCARDTRDVSEPSVWEGGALCHPEVRGRVQRLESLGLVDTFRMRDASAGQYSWWDYRMGGFQKNNGLRIDIVYASIVLAKRLKAAWIDRDEREGIKPSDHVPVVADFLAA